MKKQELIKNLKDLRDNYPENGRHVGIRQGLLIAIGAIQNLEEPKKVVIPQFVAEWYEENKKDLEYAIYEISNHVSARDFVELNEMEVWFDDNLNKPTETLIKMKLFGYEIEKEKLYYVLNKHGETLLVFMGGEVKLSVGYALRDGNKEIYQLTEKQIKDYDERYLPFMVPINEVAECKRINL